ncbi:transcriptional regulator, TetR family [Geobacter metallireducens GS-15]|uniref:Transcriptional regulator, TetR family n=1 Tax=Geobacter metallireducens (strain ATCC 53774 / DSM 7210 / GS-15) TaxID=269799 RepID=Q39TI1_GEOMG|nr:TetR/AcrR family transcriptional regulator [Geobacter metallireducens]ABB32443.1 transcriptional regulator, TetR family [Geobacter metallireducens GS-15]
MENTYDKLITAAIELMNIEGYPGASIGMLASKVGISKSTVIHYFKSKEGILLAILENFLPGYIDAFKPVLKDPDMDGVEKLHKFLHFHMKLVVERRDVLTINLRDTKYLTGKNKVIYQNQQRLYEEQVVKIIEQIQKEGHGLFRGLKPSITAKAILGMCNYATIWYKEDDRLSIEDLAEHFFAILTRGK